MAIFLNKEGILKHFDRLFTEAKKEIVMIVPYIKLNDNILDKIKSAQSNGIEILIVYRENELNDLERKKLLAFNNITLLHHPHVHAKCYLNENSIIICSMNLYDHSIKNNREMGILLDFFVDEVAQAEKLKDSWFNSDDEAIEKAIEEIQIIINASTIEKKSKYVEQKGFKFEILKTEKNQLETLLLEINKISDNKTFSLAADENDTPFIGCKNFVENVNIKLDTDLIIAKESSRKVDIRRISLDVCLPEDQLKTLKDKFTRDLGEFKYQHYKVYWPHGNSIKIYRDQKNFPAIWERVSSNEEFSLFIKGCHKIIDDLKKVPEFKKIK